MTINFPSSPTNGQLYSYGQSTWQWTGEYWSVYSAQTGYVTSVSDTGSGNSVINSLNSNTLLLKTFSGDSNVIITDTGNQLNFTLTGIKGSFGININNGLNVISTGFKGYVKMPYDGIINGWTIMGSVSGSVSIDVWKDSESNFPPTSGDTITGGNYPNLTNQFINSDNVLTGWNTNFNTNDIFAFNVLIVSGVTNINLTINVTKN